MKKNPFDANFVPTYERTGLPFVKGKGMYVSDTKGRKYLDFCSGIGVNALGYNHPGISAALKKQGQLILHASNLYYTLPQIELAGLLTKLSFADRVFLCNSGTEANEAAIKFARKWACGSDPERYHILSFSDSFHGRTYGGLSATAQEKFHEGFKPMLSGFHYAPFNDIDRTKKILSEHRFAAIFIEPVQGESGINSATTEFLRFLRDYATGHQIALVFDEVQCGLGRTGTLWQYQQHKVVPDIMTLAKPLGGGLPLAAVLCKDEIALAVKPGDHGSTFGGNPLACALGCVVLKVISNKTFLKNVRVNGDYLKKSLRKLTKGNEQVTDILGMGLMIGVRFKNDPKRLIKACFDKGLIVIKSGHNTIRFMPPLIATKRDIDKALAIFEEVLREKDNN
jgi:predicted acetylornithine/succinylornithine family transaminase